MKKKNGQREISLELEKGCTYLFEQGGYSRYPNISRGKCLDVTKTSYLIRWDSDSEMWYEKRRFVKGLSFSPQFTVKEKL